MLDVQQLISTVLDRVGTKASKFLNEEDSKALCAILGDEGIQNPFFGLHNTYQQTKYYRENLGLNVSFILFVDNLDILCFATICKDMECMCCWIDLKSSMKSSLFFGIGAS